MCIGKTLIGIFLGTFVHLGFFDFIKKQKCYIITSKYCSVQLPYFPLSLRSVFFLKHCHSIGWQGMSSAVFSLIRSFSPLLVGQGLGVQSTASLAEMRLTVRTCTKHFLLKVIGNQPFFLAAYFLSSHIYTCELEKDGCCLSHQIDFNTTGANLCQ